MSVFSVLLLCSSLVLTPQALVRADTGNWQQKGVTISPSWNGEFGSDEFKQSVKNAHDSNVNYVTLIVPIYQQDPNSTYIQSGGNTPTDESLISGITYIHSLGMHVMIKPHLENFDGEWRAHISPSDRGTWFANYTSILSHYAKIAAQYNVEDFCVGTELIAMSDATVNSTNTDNWRKLISDIRGVYSGKLTYSANWGGSPSVDEKDHIQFWDALDYIGLSGYFNLYGDNSVQNLKNQWDSYNKNEIS